jgi:hypothetical protein
MTRDPNAFPGAVTRGLHSPGEGRVCVCVGVGWGAVVNSMVTPSIRP